MNIETGSYNGSELPVPPSIQSKRTQILPSKRTLWNAITRFGGQFISMLANILFTPYVIRKLGVDSYGLVGVINTIVGFMAIITTSLSATVGRNLTFAIERKEYEKANKEISTAIFGILRLFALAFLPFCALSFFIDYLIVVPPYLVSGARFFCFLSILSFIFMTINGPLGASMFVRNRLDLTSIANLTRSLFFIAAVVVLFNTIGTSLPTYGTAMVMASLLLFFIHFRIHKYLLKSVEISNRWFDRTLLKDIVSLGGWMTLGQIGGILFFQAALLVSNRILGSSQTGQLAAISLIPLQLSVLGSLVSSLFGPTQASLFARGNIDAFLAYLLKSIRVTILIFALFVGVVCGSIHEILSIWLGNEFAILAPVTLVLTAYLVTSIGAFPLASAIFIIGKVKMQAIVTVLMGIFNVILSIVLAHKMGLMGIALAQCVTLFSLNAIFVPWYISRECGMKLWPYWREQIYGVLFSVAIALIGYFINSLVRPDSVVMLVICLSLSIGLGSLILMPYGLWILRHKVS